MRTVTLLLSLATSSWSQTTIDPSIDGGPAPSGAILMVPPGTTLRVEHLGFTRDGKTLFTQDSRQLSLWDVERGITLGGLASQAVPRYFAAEMDPSGDYLWYSNPVTLTAEKRDLRDLRLSPLFRMAIGRPNLQLASAGERALLYRRYGTGEVLLVPIAEKAEFVPLPAGKGSWTGAVLNPRGQTAAIGNFDGSLLVYDYAARKTLFEIPQRGSVITRVVYSSDGKLIAAILHPESCVQINGSSDYRLLPGSATCNAKSTVAVRDAETGSEIYSSTVDRAVSVAFAPDSRHIAIGFNDRVELVDMLRRTTARTFGLEADLLGQDPREGRFVRIAISPDGRYLAETAFGPIRIFELATGRLLRSLADPPQMFASNSVLTRGGRLLMTLDRPTHLTVTELSPGVATRILPTPAAPFGRTMISADGSTVAARTADRSVRVWNLATQQEQCRAPWSGPVPTDYEELALSADGSIAAMPAQERAGGEQGVELWDVKACRKLTTVEYDGEHPPARFPVATGTQEELRRRFQRVLRLAISPSGRYVSWATAGNDVRIWDTVAKRFTLSRRVPVPAVFTTRETATNRVANRLRLNGQPAPLPGDFSVPDVLMQYGQLHEGIGGINFGWDDEQLATLDMDGIVRVWWSATGQQRVELGAIPAEGKAFLEDGVWSSPFWYSQFVFASDGRAGISVFGKRNPPQLWDLTAGKSVRSFSGFGPYGCCANFSADGKRVMFGGGGSHSMVSDVATGQPLATIGIYGDGSDWLAYRSDGLFDGSPAAYRQHGWLFNREADRRTALPMEAFFADFFRPGLLPDTLAGRAVPPARDLGRVDRRQARVQVEAPEVNSALPVSMSRINLRIRATLPSTDGVQAAPGAIRDLRIFRNGSLVHGWHNELKPGPGGVVEVTAAVAVTAGPNEFVAYGFNQDNVQSSSGSLFLNGAQALARPANAHIIVVGINEYENAEFRLKYAAADARLIATEFAESLKTTRQYANVYVNSLIDAEATGENLRNVLVQLGGGAASPGGKKVLVPGPEDSVFFFFAGHGWATNGRFYLIPRDLGYMGPRERVAADRAVQAQILNRAISDLELGAAVEAIDAAHVALIVDACNSGQLLESEEARQGPFNSKSLAQLAWDKGAYILTAAQSYQAAMESSRFGHGYLTQALMSEGLKDRKADREPYDGQIDIKEWFEFAAMRVPQLHQEAGAQGRLLVLGKRTPADDAQTPRAFYRSDTRSRLLVAGPANSTALDCAQESALRSPSAESRPKAAIQWVNTSPSIRKLYWIDGNGNRSRRDVLAPGARVRTPAQVGDIWIYADETDRCVGVFTPLAPEESASIRK